MDLKIGNQILITGLLPFHPGYRDVAYKEGIIISINCFNSYPITVFTNGKIIYLPFDCVKII
ncbi:hypothetical protein [Virgibacillus litoralis]|uniref:DUF2187 domain-containing protein n=1 Tax=Virgibacillus litoralis TaxID=578221 RepID=A0ABS4HEJ5_9BACI|nr:hypothetical protein [Virgibacillus litoralis]MBP1949359.1 hypothetical protein [Virgibacillus litoralis]